MGTPPGDITCSEICSGEIFFCSSSRGKVADFVKKEQLGAAETAKEVVSWFSQGKNEVQLEEFQSRRDVFIAISAPDPHVVPGSLDLLKGCCQDLGQLGL